MINRTRENLQTCQVTNPRCGTRRGLALQSARFPRSLGNAATMQSLRSGAPEGNYPRQFVLDVAEWVQGKPDFTCVCTHFVAAVPAASPCCSVPL